MEKKKKGDCNKNSVHIDGEKLKAAIWGIGETVNRFIKKNKYPNPGMWKHYIYRGDAMPIDLFERVVEDLDVEPSEIVPDDCDTYGRHWDHKEDLKRTWRALRQQVGRGDITIEAYTESIVKLAPYLVPKAIQEDQNYTPERWANAMADAVIKAQSGEEPENVAEQMVGLFEGASDESE